MKKLFYVLLFFVISPTFVLSNSAISYQEQQSFYIPKPIGYVNDFEGILNEQQINNLTKTIVNYKNQTTNEIAIVILSDYFTMQDFEQYVLDLSKKWGVGDKLKNNGLVIFVSTQNRIVKLATGTGTQEILTDDICTDILQNSIIPNFSTGQYYLALQEGLDLVIEQWGF